MKSSEWNVFDIIIRGPVNQSQTYHLPNNGQNGSGYGSVGRAVASDSTGLWFNSYHQIIT